MDVVSMTHSKAEIFDLETTGLCAEDEIICFTYDGIQYIQTDDVSEVEILTELNRVVKAQERNLLVTFFGGPKYGSANAGFDIPTLRSRYLINGIPELFPFHGHSHVDMSEVAAKHFNTMVLQEPTLESLSAAQMTELTIQCNLHPMKTKDANIRQLKNEEIQPDMVTEFIKKHVKPKGVTKNDLDSIFKIYCPGADESVLNEKYSGSDMPGLFKRYRQGSDRCRMDILNHNRNCGHKIQFLYDRFIGSGLVSTLNIPTTRL